MSRPEERRLSKNQGDLGLMTTHTRQSDEFAPRPSSFLGRQWESVKRLHGWRRPVGVVAIGAEALLLAAAVVVLFII
jgi:hypothetical protein